MGTFVRHAKMTAWGLGIVIEDRGGQRTILFADGNKRSFKGDIAAKLLIPAEPESDEERIALERGAGSGGGPMTVNLELERQLPDDFADPQPFLVYADWLEQKGDPRGKLIQAHARGSAKQEREIFKEHGDVLIPRDIIKRGKVDFEWKLGFIASARFGTLDDLDDRLIALFQHPSAAMLRELVFDGDAFYGAPFATLTTIKPPRLRSVVIDNPALATGDLAPLFQLPLESLRASGERVAVVYPIKNPTLRSLDITTSRSDRKTVGHLVAADLPNLTSLSLYAHDGLDDGVPAFAFHKLPRLETLTLRNITRTSEWLASLAKTKLTTLNLISSDLVDTPVIPNCTVTLEHSDRTAAAYTAPYITDAARSISQPNRWSTLGLDNTYDRIWGTYPGTVGNYYVAVERGTDWAQCSCPSNDRPCKHALALHAMAAANFQFDERHPPSNHYALSSRRRFSNFGE
ncbi:MAG: SWIM zinc finger family protein [Kofleriaceae bacterium]